MRSITPRGWGLIALMAATFFYWWWYAGVRHEADVPSYREHRQGAIMRDSDIESILRQELLAHSHEHCEFARPPGHRCVSLR